MYFFAKKNEIKKDRGKYIDFPQLPVMASFMLSNLIGNTFRYECIQIGNHEGRVKKLKQQTTSKKLYIPDFDVISKITCCETADENVRQLQCT